MSYITREQSTGDMKGRWQSGTAQRIDSGKEARDGEVFVFLSTDWEDMELSPPVFNTGNSKIPIRAQILDSAMLLQCTAVVVLDGLQCGPWHLNLVAHVKDWLFGITPVSLSNRDVEGVGEVDYINLLWCSDSRLSLYENTSRVHGINKYVSSAGKEWDGHWYIYRRGNDTPSYAHVGLDQSATLRTQTHVADAVKEAIEEAVITAQKYEGCRDDESKRRFSWFSRKK